MSPKELIASNIESKRHLIKAYADDIARAEKKIKQVLEELEQYERALEELGGL